MDHFELFQRLSVALAVGLLIGFERGWHERDAPDGSRIAGIRTFAITGLLGGLWAVLSEELGDMLLVAAFIAYVAVLIAARFKAVKETGDHGITTIVAAMLTFALGALAVRGDLAIAAAGAVVVSLLLGVKTSLHQWLQRIERDELMAVLKLLAMTLVLLPVLPDRGYGPWQALNPYELWLMVILIATISFAGYAAVRMIGKDGGMIVAGIAGGLFASTAVTLSFSRLARNNLENVDLLAASILASNATMFPRTLLIAWLIAPAMAQAMIWPLTIASLAAFSAAFILWRRQAGKPEVPELRLRNPFELLTALQFGALLAVVMLLSRALQEWWGEGGLYVLAAVAGLSDVDAINLTLARLVNEAVLAPHVASMMLMLGVASNMVIKGILAATQGPRTLTLRVGAGLIACTVAGAAGLAIAAPVANWPG